MQETDKMIRKGGEGLFKSVMMAYLVLVLHLLLVFGLGLVVIFFSGIVQYMLWIFLLGAITILGFVLLFLQAHEGPKADVARDDAVADVQWKTCRGQPSGRVGFLQNGRCRRRAA
jgi:hypothetical protein